LISNKLIRIFKGLFKISLKKVLKSKPLYYFYRIRIHKQTLKLTIMRTSNLKKQISSVYTEKGLNGVFYFLKANGIDYSRRIYENLDYILIQIQEY